MEMSSPEPKVSVLIVDDNECMREVLATILSMRGHRCESAENGTEAIKKVMQDHFDAVITDVEMPEMDGIALTKELTQHYSNLPVMIMTGDEKSEESAIDAGAREFLRKPFDLTEFMVKFQKILPAQEMVTDQEVQRARESEFDVKPGDHQPPVIPVSSRKIDWENKG